MNDGWVRWVAMVLMAFGPSHATLADPDHFARCAACHLDDGSGVPGMFPPLAGHVQRFFVSPDGRSYLARLVLAGSNGNVEILDERYMGVMPAVMGDLSDVQVAALLNDLVRRFGLPDPGAHRLFSPHDVAAARKAGRLSLAERSSLRERALATNGGPWLGRSPPPRTPDTIPAGTRQAHEDWLLHCQGCHGANGTLATPGMPALKGQVAGYLREPGGRARLVQVPGIANASLSDARLAGVLNWMLATFDAEHLPDDFDAYTGVEVRALRRRPPAQGSTLALRSRERGPATHRDEQTR